MPAEKAVAATSRPGPPRALTLIASAFAIGSGSRANRPPTSAPPYLTMLPNSRMPTVRRQSKSRIRSSDTPISAK